MLCTAVCPKRSRCSQCQSVASEMAGCSTGAVRLQQNLCHQSCCVFLEHCMFWCLRSEADDSHFQTAGECCLPGILMSYRIMTGTPDMRVWTSLVDRQEASAIDVGWAWCGCGCNTCVPVMRHTAAFWTDRTLRMRPSDTACSSELQ